MKPPYYDQVHLGTTEQSCMLLDILNLVCGAEVLARCHHSSH